MENCLKCWVWNNLSFLEVNKCKSQHGAFENKYCKKIKLSWKVKSSESLYEETKQKSGGEKSWDEKPTEWEEISGVKRGF